MATKTKKKAKKLFPKIDFGVQQLPGCCGIGVVGYFEEETGGYDYRLNRVREAKTGFASAKAQANDCYERILKDTWDGWNDYTYLQISLVSNYVGGDKPGTAQLPALQQKLIDEGWTINMVFINPNHGNEVTLFSKYFPERLEKPNERQLEEDDWDLDDDDVSRWAVR